MGPTHTLDTLEHTFFEDLPPQALKALHLAGYGYPGAKGRVKAALRDDFLQATARHQQIKAELAPLLRAWRGMDIEALLFKGFYLAEFVYDFPAQRFYGDVDVLIDPAKAQEALLIAERLGWRGDGWSPEEMPQLFNNELMHLYSPDGSTRLDVHGYVLHTFSPFRGPQRRITQAVWQASGPRSWEGTAVRVMTYADAAIILALNRCWSGDNWTLKPHDICDLQMLWRRFGLTQAEVEARARALGCARSVAIFLTRCNPWKSHLHLETPSYRQRQLWSLAVAPERFPPSLERQLMRLSRAPGALVEALRALPELSRSVRLLRRQPALPALFEDLLVTRMPASGYARLHRKARGVRWATRLLRPFLDKESSGLCVIRSLTLHRSLTRLGYPVSFVSGVRRVGEKLEGHAWVEYLGRPLWSFGDELAPQLYRETYRYPPRIED